MILYVLKQNKNPKSASMNKWFAYPDIKETINLDRLAAHMSSHNTPFSKGAIKGMLTDMVSCIKELLLEGKNVKIADLAIFSLGIKNTKGGADSEEDFSISKNIQGVKFRARATGDLITKSLNLDATLKKANAIMKNASGTTSPSPSEGGENNGGENTNPTNPTNPNSGDNGGSDQGSDGSDQ